MMEYLIVLMMTVIIGQMISGLKATFKISYYETTLELKGINIDHIKNKSFFSMMFD